jgi:thiol-disulfide isomerase/thioredoxin
MKELIKNLVLFTALCVVFSSLSGCSGTSSPNVAGSNQAGSNAGKNNSGYPPMSAGMAGVSVEALDGTKTKVSDHKGKNLILNLWGIWCGPCREEMPHLAQMQKQYADKGLEVISLNVGDNLLNPEPIENIKKFQEQMKLEYTLARIDRDAVNQFYIVSKQQAIPQTFMVDKDGRLRGVFVGGGPNMFNQIQQTLDKMMSE